MLEEIYELLREVKFALLDSLGEFASVDPIYCPTHLASIRQAYKILCEEVLEKLEETSCLQAKTYSYEELDWMGMDFVQLLNRSSLAERFCLLGEAVSAWNSLHSHLGKRAPLCPLLDPTNSDPYGNPLDF